jgi:hypothetical protein
MTQYVVVDVCVCARVWRSLTYICIKTSALAVDFYNRQQGRRMNKSNYKNIRATRPHERQVPTLRSADILSQSSSLLTY